jgi:hypothetical protein
VPQTDSSSGHTDPTGRGTSLTHCAAELSVHHLDDHKVCRKPTDANLCRISRSHHHPSNKHAVHCGLRVPGGYFRVECLHLKPGCQCPQHFPRVAQPDEKPHSLAFLPYVTSIFDNISRVLYRPNIKSMGLPPRKISSFLCSAKCDLRLKTPEVQSILCEFGQIHFSKKAYRITPGWCITSDNICLEYQENTALAVYSIILGHRIQLHHTAITSTEHRDMVRIIIIIEVTFKGLLPTI